LTSKEIAPTHTKVLGEATKENTDKDKALNTAAKTKADADKAAATAADATLNGASKADATRVKAGKVRNDAALVQKEPEDFNDDEKEAAQAKINEANAATLTTNHKTLSDAVKANTKT
jgi:hypothetical protein